MYTLLYLYSETFPGLTCVQNGLFLYILIVRFPAGELSERILSQASGEYVHEFTKTVTVHCPHYVGRAILRRVTRAQCHRNWKIGNTQR